jgi:hypothetical protein
MVRSAILVVSGWMTGLVKEIRVYVWYVLDCEMELVHQGLDYLHAS